jgi:arabinogalactan endo-1,4-beta-galactosidase
LIERTTEKIDGSSPDRYPINWTRQIALLHKGIQAVNQINTEQSVSIQTVIHIAQPENAEWWFADAVSKGLTGFDIIGISYYPQWSDYGLRKLGDHIKQMKEKYKKDIMVVETGYPWTASGSDGAGNVLGNGSKMEVYGNTISNEIQRDFMIELTSLVKSNGGSGVIYWEPAWVSSSCKTYWGTGSHYENAALFDFDNKINSGADFLSYDYTKIPEGLTDKQVTFIVDMTDIETSHGVFVTGSFTGENRTFIPMDLDEKNQYKAIVSIPGRSVGGFIFYNNNTWNDSYKETVPISCAKMWDTHRKYVITNSDVQYAFSWSKCALESSTTLKIEDANKIDVFPSTTKKYITIQTDEAIKSLQAINLHGQRFNLNYSETEVIDVRSLVSGMYVLAIQTENRLTTCKFIKH